MGTRWLHREGPKWVDKGLITAQQLDAVKLEYRHGFSAKNVLIPIAFLCIGIGIISIIAAQWSDIPKLMRVLILAVSTALAYGTGIWAHRREAHVLCASFIILGVLLFGGSIILIGQTYQLVAYSALTFHLWATVALLCAALIRNTWCGIAGLILLLVGQTYALNTLDALSIFSFAVTVALGALCVRSGVRPQWIVAWTLCTLIQTGFLIDALDIAFSFIFVALILLYTFVSMTPDRVAPWIKNPVLCIAYFFCAIFIPGWSRINELSDSFLTHFVLIGVWGAALALHFWLTHVGRARTDGSAFVLFFPFDAVISLIPRSFLSDESITPIQQIVVFSMLLIFGLHILIRGAKMASRTHYHWGTALCLIALTIGFLSFSFSVNNFTLRSILFLSFGVLILILALFLRRKSEQFMSNQQKNMPQEIG
jgi:uncharacterized membrane protein